MEISSKWIWLVLLSTVIVVASSIQYNKVPDDGGDPEIQIKPKSYDFGDIPREIVNKTFVVENVGDAPLEITRVSTSCGCTSASVSKELLAPGDNADLFVEMDPNVMGNIAGKVKRIIYVKSNDPKQEEVEVSITANILG